MKLEWNSIYDVAKTDFGNYRIWKTHNYYLSYELQGPDGYFKERLSNGVVIDQKFPTITAAKKHAQKDYDKRVNNFISKFNKSKLQEKGGTRMEKGV